MFEARNQTANGIDDRSATEEDHGDGGFAAVLQSEDTEKENWYRTGAVAKTLGTSPHKIRELARAGLIESEERNGYRYIPGREVERLQNEGLPAMPAKTPVDDRDEIDSQDADRQQRPDGRPAARSRITQDLYAEPSRQLAKRSEEHTSELQSLRHL